MSEITNIYFIRNPETKKIKIGRSVNIEQRCSELSCVCGSLLEIIETIEQVPEYYEGCLHGIFAKDRYLGEWFFPSAHLIGFIKSIKNKTNNVKILKLKKQITFMINFTRESDSSWKQSDIERTCENAGL